MSVNAEVVPLHDTASFAGQRLSDEEVMITSEVFSPLLSTSEPLEVPLPLLVPLLLPLLLLVPLPLLVLLVGVRVTPN